jgi:hypothetical protein
MMQFELVAPNTLDHETAAYCAMHLCRDRSEMQGEFVMQRRCTPTVLCRVGSPIAWVASHVWTPPKSKQSLQTLEAFTHADWRRRGICRIGALVLLAGGVLVADHEVAVFAYECVPLAKSLGMQPRLWQRDDSRAWCEVKL